MATLPTPMRECDVCDLGDGVCNAEVVVITTSLSRELFVRGAPIRDSQSMQEQAQRFYDCLPRLLSDNGAGMSDVILERVFFRDLHADHDMFSRIRRDAYARSAVTGDQLPATSYVQQPPCRAGQALELQLHAITSSRDGSVQVHSSHDAEHHVMAKRVEIGEYQHLYLMNINGYLAGEASSQSFRQQSDTMFQRTVKLLQQHGIDFSKVLRTWCYLDNIDRDYAEFNLSRNMFFRQQQIRRLPASTGIRAGLYPQRSMCAMDLYALLNPEGTDIQVMHTPTLNEAADYGASFSRGIKLDLPDKTVLFISGTASVDERGATIHVGDIRKQIERMLLNVRELLAPHDADFSDVVQAITYLKSRQNFELFLQIWDEWGLGGLPNSIVEAGVCRPDLLCELEAIAILPKS